MKILLLTISLFAFLSSGCSSTWESFKDDSSKNYKSVKKSIHEATE